MTLADTLSKLPNPKDNGAVELDLRVDGIEMTTAEVHRCDIDLVNFSQRKQHQLRDQTARDPTMNALMETPSAIRPEHDPTTDREAERPSQSGQETVRTRSGRVIRAPARYNEYTI